VFINGVDLSDHVETLALEVGLQTQVITPFGATQAYSGATGIQTVTDPVITFYQDYAPGKVYATFLSLWQSQAVFNVVAKADSGARSVSNPEWTIPVLVTKWPVMTGTRGNRHMAPVTCTVAGIVSILTA
jgi:hypothetical protein